MKKEEMEYVATGNVRHGEWMRRYLAEAEEVFRRELTEDERLEVDRQISGRD